MWFLWTFFNTIRGFWRLLVGLAIGAFLYVWTFFYYKDLWQGLHRWTSDFMEWMASQPMFSEYSQWNMLLHLDDKLTFALYIVIGRLIWLVFEAGAFRLPYWAYRRFASAGEAVAETAQKAGEAAQTAAATAVETVAKAGKA